MRRKFLSKILFFVFIITCFVCCGTPPGACSGPTAGTAQNKEAWKNSHFYFVQITDTHFGDADHLALTQRIVESINRLPMKIEFVVHTGDITMDGLTDPSMVAKGRSVLKRLNAPIHFVPGNHDILPQKLEETRRIYVKNFGELIHVENYEGVVFIFIYTEPLALGFSVDGFEPLKQLERRLQAAKGGPVVIFHHRPCVGNFYLNKMHEGWRADARRKWVDLINSYHVKAVIAGHFHMDEFHWLNEVPLYVCSSVAGYWGRQATFRIYEYAEGKISYISQYLE